MPKHTTQNSLDKTKQLEHLGLFIHLDSQAAVPSVQDQPSGLLHGVPTVAKDNIHVTGMPNTVGTSALKDYVPDNTNAVVQTLLDAGAGVIGKTNMHELAFGITSNNKAYGAVRNAINPEMIAGGRVVERPLPSRRA